MYEDLAACQPVSPGVLRDIVGAYTVWTPESSVTFKKAESVEVAVKMSYIILLMPHDLGSLNFGQTGGGYDPMPISSTP
ncbi:hypothetical protein B9G99_15950 [Kushneria konosiri]|uniref:Uncharacterized protein n=1 Tax=Kushneria konosiri TaxID=698828 RepID=A0A2Z2H9P5_9GAMM|nr:hypothetical protein B9G99_15950 [Kushneria konosiri]